MSSPDVDMSAFNERLAKEQAEINRRAEIEAKRIEEEWKKHMSPAGALPGLSKELDEKRLKYAIPDKVFDVNASYDRILIWQIIADDENPDLVPGSSVLYAPDGMKTRNEQETPRGVIISGGLLALDVMRSNGMRIGDTVHFCELQPYRRRVAFIDSKPYYIMTLNVGDITDNEDLRERIRAGEVRIELNENGQHVVIDDGERLPEPMNPWAGADMP